MEIDLVNSRFGLLVNLIGRAYLCRQATESAFASFLLDVFAMRVPCTHMAA